MFYANYDIIFLKVETTKKEPEMAETCVKLCLNVDDEKMQLALREFFNKKGAAPFFAENRTDMLHDILEEGDVRQERCKPAELAFHIVCDFIVALAVMRASGAGGTIVVEMMGLGKKGHMVFVEMLRCLAPYTFVDCSCEHEQAAMPASEDQLVIVRV